MSKILTSSSIYLYCCLILSSCSVNQKAEEAAIEYCDCITNQPHRANFPWVLESCDVKVGQKYELYRIAKYDMNDSSYNANLTDERREKIREFMVTFYHCLSNNCDERKALDNLSLPPYRGYKSYDAKSF